MKLSAGFKVPLGGFRGGFPADMACCNEKSWGGVEV